MLRNPATLEANRVGGEQALAGLLEGQIPQTLRSRIASVIYLSQKQRNVS